MAVGYVGWRTGTFARLTAKKRTRHVATRSAVRSEPKFKVGRLARRIASQDAAAVGELVTLLAPPAPTIPPPTAGDGAAEAPAPVIAPAHAKLSEEESTEYVAALRDLRTGHNGLNPAGKVAILDCFGKMMTRIAAEPCAAWSESLEPARQVVQISMADPNIKVRVAAINLTGQFWNWAPDRSVFEVEEKMLADWKAGLYAAAQRHLYDPDFECRVAAVMCLAALPLDDKAAPALELLKDSAWQVRLQVVVSFADRRDLLTNELLLPRLYDFSELAELTAKILKARGLNTDQVGLAKMMVHPNPRVRDSAIPLLLKRDDIDQGVWLLYLSRDQDEMVRFQAVAAFEGRVTEEVRRRLEEMAAKDPSPAVREAARKLVPASTPTSTAALPPLPGSPSLNPKAN
jgi:hypothetical protein